MSKRTARDEAQYLAELKREEPIKGEVIAELREQNGILWKNQLTLLRELIAANDALRVFREQALTRAAKAVAAGGDCVPGCRKHAWDSAKGWHRP
jgi:hypothetical protein